MPSKQEVLNNLDVRSYYSQSFPGIRWNGKSEAQVKCIFHDDGKTPSLAINCQTGEFHCFGCEAKGSVFDFHMRQKGLTFPEAVIDLADISGVKDHRKHAAEYSYTDENGKPVFVIRRFLNDDSSKTFRAFSPDGKPGLNGAKPLPYHLPELVKSETVYICEGEKDVETLRKQGLTATTNPFGAGKWQPELNAWFKGKNIIILGDNDEPGRKHGLSVAQNLSSVAKSIKIVTLPGLPEKGDVTDFLKDHNKDKLLAICEATEAWKATEILSLWDTLPSGTDLQAMDVHVEWLVDGLIPKQSVTTLAGKGGTGKTYLLMSLMDAVTKGEPFLGLPTCQMDAVLVDFENSLPVDVERARALNITKAKFWHNGMDPKPPRIDSPEYTLYMTIPPCLMIFDSLRAAQSGDENSSKDMTLAMNRYKELRDYGHHVIIIQHTQKANERMFRGSMAISDQADHPLYFYPVRSIKSDEAVEDANFDELPFYLGTTEKTRYNHFKVYIKRAGNGRFVVAEDPRFEKIYAIAELCQGQTELKKEKVIELINQELGYGKGITRKLLDDKEGKKYWTVTQGNKNSQLFSFYPLYKGGRTEEQKSASYSDIQSTSKENNNKVINNTELFSYSGGVCRTEEQDIDPDFPPEQDFIDEDGGDV
jgi:hypothetical protein